jgi:hypothetical protein
MSAEPVTLEDAKQYLTPEEFGQLEQLIGEKSKRMVFFPTAKQQMVVESEADIIGYGGAAGGGKSYLLCGTALSQHRRTSITRPQKNQCKKFVNEIAKMLGGRDGYSSQNSEWQFRRRTASIGSSISSGSTIRATRRSSRATTTISRPTTKSRRCARRTSATRSRGTVPTIPGQRVRAILTFNPPTTPEGRWVIRFFAPWLDKAHPNPREGRRASVVRDGRRRSRLRGRRAAAVHRQALAGWPLAVVQFRSQGASARRDHHRPRAGPSSTPR